MKKYIVYIVSGVLCALAMTVIFAGYFMHEYRLNMANGIEAPIVVAACFLCFYIAENVCLHADKRTTSIVLAIVKNILFVVGLFFVFRHTVIGVGFLLMLAFIIPVFLPIGIAMFAVHAIMLICGFVIFYIGIIAEPIMIAFACKRKARSTEQNVSTQ